MANDIKNFLYGVYMAHRTAVWVSAGVFVLALLWLFRRSRSRVRLCLDSSEIGTVSVSPAALQEVVQAVCRKIVPDGRSWVRIRRRRSRLHVRVTMRMPMDRSACACARTIQEAVADCLRSQFGIERSYAIDLIIGGFRGSSIVTPGTTCEGSAKSSDPKNGEEPPQDQPTGKIDDLSP
ncbi:MAG: hypothetical protein LBH53_02685 [Puniceicoccales bacterium]|jgi:hypothetical protein|nr:hypothetical protein [Puniceicoccales bacterium]